MITIKELGNENHLGRLGNQLFEISSILGISSDNKHEAFFPHWKYSTFFKNPLNYLDISYEKTISEYEYINSNYTIEPGNYNLHGFFQSEKYFKKIEDDIRYFFSLKDEYQNIVDSYDLLLENNLKIEDYNFVTMDIQGAEGLALKGFGDMLNNVDYLFLEINEKELYKGCMLLPEMCDYLSHFGFNLLEKQMWGDAGWGDAFFAKKKYKKWKI